MGNDLYSKMLFNTIKESKENPRNKKKISNPSACKEENCYITASTNGYCTKHYNRQAQLKRNPDENKEYVDWLRSLDGKPLSKRGYNNVGSEAAYNSGKSTMVDDYL